MTRTTPKALNDQMYSMKLEAGRLGHALKGKPRCICGFKASSPAELDDHLYGIVHPKSDES